MTETKNLPESAQASHVTQSFQRRGPVQRPNVQIDSIQYENSYLARSDMFSTALKGYEFISVDRVSCMNYYLRASAKVTALFFPGTIIIMVSEVAGNRVIQETGFECSLGCRISFDRSHMLL